MPFKVVKETALAQQNSTCGPGGVVTRGAADSAEGNKNMGTPDAHYMGTSDAHFAIESAGNSAGSSKMARWKARTSANSAAALNVRGTTAVMAAQEVAQTAMSAKTTPAKSKASRWVARVAGKEQDEKGHEPTAKLETAPKTAVVVNVGGSKAERWTARISAKSALEVSGASICAVPSPRNSSGSKTERWVARAAASVVHALPTLHMAQVLPHTPGQQKAILNGYKIPVTGSAMESWLSRASAKQMHLSWPEKKRDYVDEVTKLKNGLSEKEILDQRRHLNPPDDHRTYSSIRATPDLPPISGVGWGRGCLDSKAAWCPADNTYGWMEIFLQEETELFGIVTQGQAATCCSGTVGICERLCPPPHNCKGGGEVNYATNVRVTCKMEEQETSWQEIGDFDIGKGGEVKRETYFPSPVRACYVRLFVTGFKGNIALRAGLLVGPRDHLVDASPFSLRAAQALAPSRVNALGPDYQNSTSGPATGDAETFAKAPAAGTKAARWAARLAAKEAHCASPQQPMALTETSAPATSPEVDDDMSQDEPTERVSGSSKPIYTQISTPALKYSGWFLNGVPHDCGRMKMSDGSEYHGDLKMGNPHGEGVYFFPDKSKLNIGFCDGCPKGKGILIDRTGDYWNVEYNGKTPVQEGPQPSFKEQSYREPYVEETIDCMALSVGHCNEVERPDGSIGMQGKYPNVPGSGSIASKLVFARPQFGDMPLWNDEDARGAIVVVLDGPMSKDYECSFALKIHHAQMAGAKAVVIVSTRSTFDDWIPVVQEGPINYGVKPVPADFDIRIMIPAVVILSQSFPKLQEGALHVIHYLDETKVIGVPFGSKVGFLHVPKQESKVGLDKRKAETLMQEFFSERRKERSEEAELLKGDRKSGKDQSEASLKSREFFGGNFFDSMNPFKENKGTEDFSKDLQIGMMNKVRAMPVVGELQRKFQEKMEILRQDIEVALPVVVTWDDDDDPTGQETSTISPNSSMGSLQKAAVDAGIKIPKIQPKDPRGNFVWKASGEPPYRLIMQCSHLAVCPCVLNINEDEDKTIDISICYEKEGSFEGTVHCKFKRRDREKVAIILSVDERGYHLTSPMHKVQKETSASTEPGPDIYFMPHGITLEVVSMERLATLPLTPVLRHKDVDLHCPRITRLSPDAGAYLPPPALTFKFDLNEWTLVFRQTCPFEFSLDNDWAQVKSFNEENPEAENFSILDSLEEYRCSDGKFTMLLRWPLDAPESANIFRQSSNPVTMDELGVHNYTPVRIDFNQNNFGGLQRTIRKVKPTCACFMDGCIDHCDTSTWYYAIGTANLWGGMIPGPFSQSRCVELYVTTKNIGIVDEPKDFYGSTPPENPFCEHGKQKKLRSCEICNDPFAGHITVDHCPYYPCTSGHGPRWLWDLSEAGEGRMTLNSKYFFRDLESNEERAFRTCKWPVLFNAEFQQTACSGYHNFMHGDQFLFSGWLRNGLPEGMCSVRWSDGSEYHGEFLDGEMTGYGRYIFPDSSEFRGDFKNGLPGIGMYHATQVQGGMRYLADYAQSSPKKALWELEKDQLMHPYMVEMPLPRYFWVKADCLGVVEALPGRGPDTFNCKHLERTITAQLVWARPILCDQPLWNASECRGKIVCIMRGPRAPAPSCNYSIKLFYAQSAGAAAVIFVDFNPFSKFTVIPRVENGPIYEGGPVLSPRIPCFLILGKDAGVLQEGAVHTVTLAQNLPPDVPNGWKIGFCFCRKQEGRRLMSKAEEDRLMQDFFGQRRLERSQENELLQDQLEDLRSGVSCLDNKEFVGGDVLDSLNFSKQDLNAPPPKTKSGTVAQAMLAKVTSKERAKQLADKAEAAARILGGLVEGAIGTMTGEVTIAEAIETARSWTPSRQRSRDDSEAGMNKSNPAESDKRRSQSAPRQRTSTRERISESNGRDKTGKRALVLRHANFQDDHSEDKSAAEELRREREQLLARLKQLEAENEKLREDCAELPTWSPSSTEGTNQASNSSSTLHPKSLRPGKKPEWM